ncbi:hypothetical protein DMH04_01610 [Kibdelosporangium aridum]|uniref:Uncharacterized protein n=1 Tax=Kibdelosporangium aridum TaxID=2030 RepID=A0A428ZUH4_KIBAR|nr:DUF6098 family protein [Kibdelosporangium aridum]RSM91697.1 hypothetical protein DMH04_01610 [Kibdelosporangium aridum]
MPVLTKLDQLIELMAMDLPLFLRYSPGPEADVAHPSVDHESGLQMPGHSANPLRPPSWWTLPTEDWMARRICQYLRKLDEGARPWVLTGEVTSHGPDNEPLLVNVTPVAWLGDELLAEAHQRYTERMNAGKSSA